jgi:hypothetical protein
MQSTGPLGVGDNDAEPDEGDAAEGAATAGALEELLSIGVNVTERCDHNG